MQSKPPKRWCDVKRMQETSIRFQFLRIVTLIAEWTEETHKTKHKRFAFQTVLLFFLLSFCLDWHMSVKMLSQNFRWKKSIQFAIWFKKLSIIVLRRWKLKANFVPIYITQNVDRISNDGIREHAWARFVKFKCSKKKYLHKENENQLARYCVLAIWIHKIRDLRYFFALLRDSAEVSQCVWETRNG